MKICRRSTLVFALLWFGTWVFLNGLVFVHRTILSDYCTDDKSKRILQRVVSSLRGMEGSRLRICFDVDTELEVSVNTDKHNVKCVCV